jgi:hypothetical protein
MLRNWMLLGLLASASFGMLLFAEEGGFTPLFDGKTLEGWEQQSDLFRVEGEGADAAIVAGSLEKSIPRNEFLVSEKEYGDFELRLEAKLEGKGQNAGIQFRSQRVPNHHEVTGYQCDAGILDGKSIWGALYDESRRNCFLAHDAEVCAKATQEGWNQVVIRCEGPRIQIWVNGVRTVDYTETDDQVPRTGKIALQIHGGEPALASYRGIRIKDLSDDAAN